MRHILQTMVVKNQQQRVAAFLHTFEFMDEHEKDLKAFAARLIDLCLEHGLIEVRGRQKRLGKLIGVSQQACSRWLNGTGWPSREDMVRLAQWGRVLPGWLAYGVGPKRPEDLYPDDQVASLVTMYQLMDPAHQVALYSVAKSLAVDVPKPGEINAERRPMTQ